MSDWDPHRAARIDREKKHQREGKKIDYRDMNDWDEGDFEHHHHIKNRNKKT